jgi:putative transposase
MIVAFINEAVRSGARLSAAAELVGLSARTVIRWKKQGGGKDRREGPKKAPKKKLSETERQQVLDAANSPQFRDVSPKQIVPKLADQGVYIASESSFYRILREHHMITHRQSAKPPTSKPPKEKVATGPCQVWTWDITFLKTTVRGTFFYLYMFVDIWSRKIVAARVFEKESMDYSARLFTTACMVHGVDANTLVLHSDNGGPMKGSTMLATLQKLGVVPSFSRPKVSDDNPFSEALFRTMKYRPEYPSGAFESMEDAQAWVDEFVLWYNTQHLHSAIRFITPDDRHYGRQEDILSHRNELYQKAKKKNPARWSGQTRNWQPVRYVWLNPENSKDDVILDNQLKEAA